MTSPIANTLELTDISHYAPYACLPSASRGRLHPEPESITRTCFQRDRDRIIHSAAFRRLEYKTQVFVNHEGDHYRTRLTHSLEVSQIARSLARNLSVNEELAEALSLAHDLGHTPFGHAGEDALNAVMKDYGGFDHNAQTIRIITKLEHRYADFDGLNLTWETLEGIAKHNGPVDPATLPRALKEYCGQHDLELHTYPSIEAQIAALADDIAYHNHDIDDGLRAGVFDIEKLQEVPEVYEVIEEVRKLHPGLESSRLIHESVRRLIHLMCMDLLETTMERIEESNIKCVEDIRGLGQPLVAFSKRMDDLNARLKNFLMNNMYRHYKVNRMTSKAERVISDLFGFFMEQPQCLPPDWFAQTEGANVQIRAETVCDFIAGMTDRFALQEHQRIFDVWAKN